jgi:hypothetical protein
MALRAFLDPFAGVPRGAYPASRSHNDHAEGDRYALFHRSAFFVDYRVISGRRGIAPSRPGRQGRLPVYTLFIGL